MKLVKFVAPVALTVMVSACAITPEHYGECRTLFQEESEALKCEARVLRAEIRRVEKRERLARQQACRYPNVWDKQTERCLDPHTASIYMQY